MKYIVSKEFILEAHEAWSSEWKSKIEKEVPELFKNRLEVGKWYWSIANKLICLTSVDVLRAYYYGFSSSNDWIGKEWMDNASVDIEATKEEVETALIAEARKRGFKEGVNYDSTNVGFPSQIKCYINSNEFLYKTNNVLLIDNWRIFADGNWATIVLEDEVKELTVAELEEKLGYKIKIVK